MAEYKMSQDMRVIPFPSTRKGVVIKYKCLACGNVAEDSSLVCVSCGESETITPEEDRSIPEIVEKERRKPEKASDISPTRPAPISTGREAWDLALGGGLVHPSSVLIQGPPGVGKSTTALAIAVHVAEILDGIVLYGSAEMPKELVREYADRVKMSDDNLQRLFITDEGETESLIDDIVEYKPCIVVWDSVQRFRWRGELGLTELKNVFSSAIRAAITYKHICLLISHVTKEGEFIGPNEMGHDADVRIELSIVPPDVLSIECREKNRFASTPRFGRERLLTPQG